jgi:soluble lytic murein transglycosylase-like protein
VTLALAAYNAGLSRVNQYGGVPPFEETRNYISRVLSYQKSYQNN